MKNTVGRILKWAGVAFAAVVVVVGALAAHTWYGTPLKANWFYDRVMLQVALDVAQKFSILVGDELRCLI